MDLTSLGRNLSLVVGVLHVIFFLFEFFPKSVIPMQKQKGAVAERNPGKVEILYANQ